MEKERHKKAVEENRQYLKQLSTAVLSLCKQELPLRGHDERSDRRNHRELSNVLLNLPYALCLLPLFKYVHYAQSMMSPSDTDDLELPLMSNGSTSE